MPNKKEELQTAALALKQKAAAIEKLLAEGEFEKAQALVHEVAVRDESHGLGVHEHATRPTNVPEGSRILEGVFDGQHMIGADGKQYLVPQNYASKSKLVEGDMMKLAITPPGAFIYKQIGPIARKRITGTLTLDDQNLWHATDGVHEWRLLTAAVTYFKGKVGEEVVILIPGDAPSKWAAVENIIAR